MLLKNKKALITGGSRGIGAKIAERLAQEGAYVCITYNTSSDAADALVNTIEEKGGNATALAFNAEDPETARAVVDKAVNIMGGLDILVNNAGIYEGVDVFTDDFTAYEKTLTINVRSAIAITLAAANHLPENGRIINISSIWGERGAKTGNSAYAMSKFALAGLTRAWAWDFAAKSITVNTIQPGPIDTDMNPANSDWADEFRSITPLGRYGTTDEVAGLAVFLASPNAAYITGACIRVDGGINA